MPSWNSFLLGLCWVGLLELCSIWCENVPLSKYFKGHGEKVMSSMKKTYGPEKGESVFYATANKAKKLKAAKGKKGK